MDNSQRRGDVFGEMGQFWAEIADESQTQRQIEFLKIRLSREGWVLDVACGTGRHTIALCRADFDVVGLDVSLNLLKIAKTRGASMLVRCDMRFLPFKTETFRAAISMDNSFGYLPTEKEDAQSLDEVRRVLKVDGLFVMDVFNREKLFQKYGARDVSSKLYDYPSLRCCRNAQSAQTGVGYATTGESHRGQTVKSAFLTTKCVSTPLLSLRVCCQKQASMLRRSLATTSISPSALPAQDSLSKQTQSRIMFKPSF
jgi:ubiquinone/menaquinone biosynthesis C-methylase UbiE